jgi:coatomer subunit beta
VKVICIFLRRSPVHITDARCVAAFASLMLSPYATVLYECDISLLSLIPVAPGFIFSVARAYFYEVKRLPPRSSLISNVVGMLDTLENISLTMAGCEEFTYFAMDVLVALQNRNLLVRKRLLNMAVNLITLLNVDDVLLFLRTELDMPASADTPLEYKQMLEKAITEIHSAHPVCIMPFIVEAKYDVYVDCIGYIMDIIVNNPLQRRQFLNGLLRVLRLVKSSVVCAATVWAISVSTVPRKEVCHVLTAISSHFKDMLEQRKIEKQINGELDVQHGFTLYTDHYSTRQGEAEGRQQQPWLMDMEELLFVHLGFTQQADGSYAIASSSRSSTDDEDESLFTPPSLEPTDNLARLVWSGDALLTDFVCNVVSRLEKMVADD